MVRKIFKTGNSFVVSLPREHLRFLGWQEGSEAHVAVDQAERRIVIEHEHTDVADIDAALAQQLSDFIEQYRPSLEALAK